MGLMVLLVVSIYAGGQVPTLSIIIFLTGDFSGDWDTGETGFRFILQR